MIEQKKVHQDELTYISSQFSKLMKKNFGKGPNACFSFFDGEMMTIHVRHFKTPAEEVLFRKNEKGIVFKFRSCIMDIIFSEFKPIISKILNIEFDVMLHDWNYEVNTGIVVFKINQKASFQPQKMVEVTSVPKQLKEKLIQAFSETYQVPRSLEIFEFHKTLTIVKCNEVLLPLERDLHRKGYVDLLLQHSYDIKKKLIAYKESFTIAFPRREIIDLFTVWDYENNNNYLFFHLKGYHNS